MTPETTQERETAHKIEDLASRIRTNIGRVIVGKSDIVDLFITALFAKGHVLLEDVPGTGKTKLARALARSVDSTFTRVQFTADLLPSDLTGIHYYNQKLGEFIFRAGPLFTNILLADEINRATARTQSSLLECMEERQVTVDGDSMLLNHPFFVVATENPVETQGTFPLPEAQLDRFLMRLRLGYPEKEDAVKILSRFRTEDPLQTLVPVCHADELILIQEQVEKVRLCDSVFAYIVDIIEATRSSDAVLLGASPRASLALMKASQAHAAIHGRMFVTPDDVKDLVIPVLAHRLILRSTSSVSLDGQYGKQYRRASELLRKILGEISCPTEDFSI